MEKTTEILRSIYTTVEQSLEDEFLAERINTLKDEAGITFHTITRPPTKESLLPMILQLISVSDNLGETEMKLWPSGARNMLARALSGVAYLYSSG